ETQLQTVERGRVFELRPVAAALHDFQPAVGNDVAKPLPDLYGAGGVVIGPDDEGGRLYACQHVVRQHVALADIHDLQAHDVFHGARKTWLGIDAVTHVHQIFADVALVVHEPFQALLDG